MLSNNCGNVLLDGSTASRSRRHHRHGHCKFSNSTRNCDRQYDRASRAPSRSPGGNLDLKSGDFSGSSIAMVDGSAGSTVTKADAVAIGIPSSYEWVAQDGAFKSSRSPLSRKSAVGYTTLQEAVDAAEPVPPSAALQRSPTRTASSTATA